MALRMKMADTRNEQLRVKAMQDRVDLARSQAFIDDAQRTWAQTDKKLQSEYASSRAYIKEMRVLDEALAKAENPMDYQSAADAKGALNKAAIKRGMHVDPIDPSSIPPFMTPSRRQPLLPRKSCHAGAGGYGGSKERPHEWLG